MRRRIVFAGMVAGLALALLAPAASAGRVDYRAPLSHAQEVGDVTAPGAGGHAVFELEGSVLHYSIDVRHLTGPAVMAHIHAPGARGTNAAVDVWLCGTAAAPGPAGTPACNAVTTGSLVEGSVAVDATNLAHIENGEAYVNVHTAAHLGGEVRGQILTVGGN